jgi:hypothetical protein
MSETMMQQIRRLNEQEIVQHELRRQEAIKKIQKLREQQKRNQNEKHTIDS